MQQALIYDEKRRRKGPDFDELEIEKGARSNEQALFPTAYFKKMK